MTRRTIAVVVAALALPASAQAHTGIRSYSPERGSTRSDELSLVKVRFRSRVSDAELTVERNGEKVSRGDGRLVRDDREARTRLRSNPRDGTYRATVRWLSRDGHVQSDTWTFKVR